MSIYTAFTSEQYGKWSPTAQFTPNVKEGSAEMANAAVNLLTEETCDYKTQDGYTADSIFDLNAAPTQSLLGKMVGGFKPPQQPGVIVTGMKPPTEEKHQVEVTGQ